MGRKTKAQKANEAEYAELQNQFVEVAGEVVRSIGSAAAAVQQAAEQLQQQTEPDPIITLPIQSETP